MNEGSGEVIFQLNLDSFFISEFPSYNDIIVKSGQIYLLNSYEGYDSPLNMIYRINTSLEPESFIGFGTKYEVINREPVFGNGIFCGPQRFLSGPGNKFYIIDEEFMLDRIVAADNISSSWPGWSVLDEDTNELFDFYSGGGIDVIGQLDNLDGGLGL